MLVLPPCACTSLSRCGLHLSSRRSGRRYALRIHAPVRRYPSDICREAIRRWWVRVFRYTCSRGLPRCPTFAASFCPARGRDSTKACHLLATLGAPSCESHPALLLHIFASCCPLIACVPASSPDSRPPGLLVQTRYSISTSRFDGSLPLPARRFVVWRPLSPLALHAACILGSDWARLVMLLPRHLGVYI
ncbi:hypothetical protein DFH09DRAFT_1317656 [Mycena vulgaris]|nr:hypothetical protein DFH09DRAFT_1317656 [Mycena vulgaris]